MKFLEAASTIAVPLIICLFSFFLIKLKKDGIPLFLEGARDGIKTTIELLPALVMIVVGVKMLTASGAADFFAGLISSATDALGIPSSLLPLLLTRPFSGSASMASFNQLMAKEGADSFPAFCASVIMGSSDTIVYIIGVYFSSVGVTKSRYALPAAFSVMIFCVFFACFLGRIFY